MASVVASKRFLSDTPNEGGSIRWVVEQGLTDFGAPIEGNIVITDCIRSIKLELDCYELKDIPNRIDKVQSLIDELERCKQSLVSAKNKLTLKHRYY